jgi:hypothetical protein
MRRFILMAVLALAAAALAAGSAGSATSKSSFLVFSEPSTTAAGDGATIETELAGSFDVATKTAAGDGEYDSTAIGSGTFTLTQLIAFQFYGCGYVDDINLNDGTLCGGRAQFAAHFSPNAGAPFDGTIEINCQIHGASTQPPPGTSEGIKVNTRGINFNKHVTGDNVFIKT